MSERWTKGPWESYGSLVYANRPQDGGTICQVSEVRHSHIVQHKEPELGSPDAAEIYANARLIAAAPDLYAALEGLLHETELAGNANAADYGWPTVVPAARAALANARGDG